MPIRLALVMAVLRPVLSKFATLLPFLILMVGLVSMANAPAVLDTVRHAVFDHYQRWRPAEAVGEPVRVIDIDEESLARFGQWPWSREVLAQLADRLFAAGVSVVGFDMLFAEADRHGRDDGGLESASAGSDSRFARSLANGPSVIGFVLAQRGTDPSAAGMTSHLAATSAELLGGLHRFPAALNPLPVLGRAAALGAINFVPDDDGVIRRLPLMFMLDGRPVPSLTAEMLRMAQPGAGFLLDRDPLAGLTLGIGPYRIPLSVQGEMWIRQGLLRAGRYIPAWKVLRGEADLAALKGMPVLVGASAQTLMDLRFSALGEVVPGVEVHAQVLDQVRAGQWLLRPAQAVEMELLLLCIAGGAVAALALRTRALVAALSTLLVLLAMAAASWQAFVSLGVLLDPAVAGGFVILIFVSGSLVRHIATERRQRWIRHAFARYVSPNLVDHLVSHPEALELGGVRRVCSFLFTDLEGYTALMERYDPARVISLVNAYLDGMIRIAFRHQGTLDRIVGDAVMVMFSAPLVQADHACRALACAREMNEFSREFASSLNAEGVGWGQTRIGVHTGEVIVGNIGGASIFDYSALGDAVNIASRLEGANKYLGTLICVSQETLAQCPGTPARPAARLVLKGRSGAIAVSELLCAGAGEGAIGDVEYEAAYGLMAAGDEAALDAFARLASHRPRDPLVAVHLARLRAGEHGDLIVLADK
ncbi:adenylate/guanylate cyclase domain-containing protein [Azoarcus sp. L1K30]|uniref:CHASE2 domain-containing protein n=1 Tax=Azoarcus sp. L1K30 TaxID=2820277 RepID=UPI001B82F101|nr:adenylate/guanylate cyclase domain-containing protein [Azoarcus sp. L1K30]MBR0566701.1 adenylate/guanylate cyclase domain-containing protein [Azoarcus sp. L1K30]